MKRMCTGIVALALAIAACQEPPTANDATRDGVVEGLVLAQANPQTCISAPQLCINVRQEPYNATGIGDPQHDDFSSIRAALTDAISQCKILYFPAGTYYTSNTLVIGDAPPCSEFEIQGAGADSSVLRGNGTGLMLGTESGTPPACPAMPLLRTRIRDMGFKEFGQAIWETCATDVVIERCAVRDGTQVPWGHVRIDDAQDLRISDSDFTNGYPEVDYVIVSRSTGVTIDSNHFTGGKSMAITFNTVHGFSAVGNHIENGKMAGIYVANAGGGLEDFDGLISGNRIEHITRDTSGGRLLDGTSHCGSVGGCNEVNSYGVYMQGGGAPARGPGASYVHDVTVENNIITDVNTGIYLGGYADYNHVNGNYISHATLGDGFLMVGGILLDYDSDHNTISLNTIEDVDMRGISVHSWCDYNFIERNTIADVHQGHGIRDGIGVDSDSKNNTMYFNTLNWSGWWAYGIRIDNSRNASILWNSVHACPSSWGIYLQGDTAGAYQYGNTVTCP